jgi:hypothetical protein
MPLGLKETLEEMQKGADRERKQREEAPEKLAEWVAVIGALYAQIKEFLAEHKLLGFASKIVHVREDHLGGDYEIEGLLIFAPGKAEDHPVAVALYPAASARLASSGVVDMFRTDRPSHKVQFYRLRDPATEKLEWHIGQTGNRKLLTKASLEAELDTMLRL